MEVGEDDLPFAQTRPLRLDRLLHFQDHFGLRPDGVGGRRDLRSGRPVRVVVETRADAGALLHQDRVAVAGERFRSRRDERNAVLRGFDFLRYADDHGVPPLGPSETTVCRSGAKNSAAIADTSSAVSASTVRSTSSRLRYDSPYTAVLAKRYILAVGLSSDNISCPSVCCFASSSASPRNPSLAMRANSALIASTAFSALPGCVPIYTPAIPTAR